MIGLYTEIESALNTIVDGLEYDFMKDVDINEVDDDKMKALTKSKTEALIGAKKIINRWLDSPNKPSDKKIVEYIERVIKAGDKAIKILRRALSKEIDYKKVDSHKHAAALSAKPLILESIFEIDSNMTELRDKLESGDLTFKDREFVLGYPELYANSKLFKTNYYKQRLTEDGAVIICPRSTQGDRITIDGLDIILPSKPKLKNEILFHDLPKEKQKWTRLKEPNITTSNVENYKDYIVEEYRRRVEGVWFYNNGKPTYITGNHYFAMQHCKMLDDGGYMNFRVAQQKLFYFMEACLVDPRCLGMLFGKSRRTGFTYAAIFATLNRATKAKNTKHGMMSKSGADGAEAFAKMTYAFMNLPFWLRPVVRGKLDSPNELFFGQPVDNSREKKKTQEIEISDYFNTSIDWRNTKNSSYDSIKLDTYILDECFSPNTKILTIDGFKEIQNINIGDKVVNHKGDIKNVVNKINGTSFMYRVCQPYGKDYIVSENHKLYLDYGHDIKSSKNLFITPKEYFEKEDKHRRYFRRITTKPFLYEKRDLPIDPYFLGLWLGDGLSSGTGVVVNTVLDREVESYLKDFVQVNELQYTMYDTPRQCSVFHINDKNSIGANQTTGTKHKLRNKLSELNLIQNKHIPNIYLTSSIEDRLKLLAGIIDSDGYRFGNNSYEIGMSREGLIRDIYKLSKELGLDTSEVKFNKTNFDTNRYSVRFTDYFGTIPCKVERKKPIPTKKVKRRSRMYITKEGAGDYVGITTDGETDEDRLLVLEDYTVSKNCGKIEKPNDVIVHLSMVAPTMMPNGRVVGKMLAGSTMGVHAKGGEQFIELITGSKVQDRDKETDKTATGLYFHFLPAQENMEEFTDVYGKCWTTTPPKGTINVFGKEITRGSEEYLIAIENQKRKQSDTAYNEQVRTYPRTVEYMMRNDSNQCVFNSDKLQEQIDHNNTQAQETLYTVGNLDWSDGEDTDVIFYPNRNGRFKIAWMPSVVDGTQHLANRVKKINGSYFPLNKDLIRFGCDPFSLKSTHGEGSKGALHGLSVLFPEGGCPANTFVLEYIARPSDETIFFEDVIKCVRFYGSPILVESNRIDLLRHMRNRGYRGFVMDRLDRHKHKLNPNEIEYGGQPMSSKDILDSHMNSIGSWIEKYVGLSTNPETRDEGEMGNMVFNETLVDWLRFNPEDRTKFDATISSGLAIMACRIEKYKGEKKKENTHTPVIAALLRKYTNSGDVSQKYTRRR